jgi:glycosyltransferase involved in cell wall biosynthesis
LIEEQKRISDLARAFCRVVRENSGLEAWIVGIGAGEANVREIIRSENMENRVILKGRVDPTHIPELLGQCQVFSLLSDYEGTPLSLIEAMSLGLVPICLETRSGIAEVISHMTNGIVIRDREQSFSDAVSYLTRNPAAWSRLSAAARQTIAERYSEEHCFARWKELLVSESPRVIDATRQPSLFLDLPPRNPKLAPHDERQPTGIAKAWSFVRRSVGTTRRKVAAAVRSSLIRTSSSTRSW